MEQMIQHIESYQPLAIAFNKVISKITTLWIMTRPRIFDDTKDLYPLINTIEANSHVSSLLMSLEPTMTRITIPIVASKPQVLLTNNLNTTRCFMTSITIVLISFRTLSLKTYTPASIPSKPINAFRLLIYYRRSAARK